MAAKAKTTGVPAVKALALLPVSLFGAIMGLAGTSVAWRWSAQAINTRESVATVLAWFALAAFAVLTVAYLAKAIRHFDAVRAEWAHPVKMAFVPTITIAMLVLAMALHAEAPALAEVLWWAGASGQAILTVGIVRAWIGGSQFSAAHIHPGWFIPAVGNIVAPIAGVNYAPEVLTWYFFGVGIVYWLALFPMVLTRLVASDPLPPMLWPTLAILIAPPAVGAAAWVAVAGQWGDPVATILLSVAVFQGVLLLSQVPDLLKAPFGPSAWAYTFPLAALTGALLAAYAADSCEVCKWFGIVSLAVLTTVVGTVLVRTVGALAKRTLLMPEPAPKK